MVRSLSTDLLMRLCRATPEQLAAVERILAAGTSSADRERGAGQPDYMLRKGLGGWRLVFEGREAVLPDEKGVSYVAVLLGSPPAEAFHASELANRAFGDAVVESQRNLAVDDRETVRAMAEARRRCCRVIEDPEANELEKEEAHAELKEITEWARRHLRGTEGGEQRQARAIRQAMRRLLARLADSGDPVLERFGAHLEQHLWRPSCRGTASGKSRIRSGLAGRFTYEPPEGVRWQV